MKVIVKQLLTSDVKPSDYYELLGRPRFDPDLSGILATIREALREAMSYQNGEDRALVARALKLQHELGRAELTFSQADRLTTYRETLAAGLRETLAGEQPDWQTWPVERMCGWLMQKGNVHAAEARTVAGLMRPDLREPESYGVAPLLSDDGSTTTEMTPTRNRVFGVAAGETPPVRATGRKTPALPTALPTHLVAEPLLAEAMPDDDDDLIGLEPWYGRNVRRLSAVGVGVLLFGLIVGYFLSGDDDTVPLASTPLLLMNEQGNILSPVDEAVEPDFAPPATPTATPTASVAERTSDVVEPPPAVTTATSAPPVAARVNPLPRPAAAPPARVPSRFVGSRAVDYLPDEFVVFAAVRPAALPTGTLAQSLPVQSQAQLASLELTFQSQFGLPLRQLDEIFLATDGIDTVLAATVPLQFEEAVQRTKFRSLETDRVAGAAIFRTTPPGEDHFAYPTPGLFVMGTNETAVKNALERVADEWRFTGPIPKAEIALQVRNLPKLQELLGAQAAAGKAPPVFFPPWVQKMTAAAVNVTARDGLAIEILLDARLPEDAEEIESQFSAFHRQLQAMFVRPNAFGPNTVPRNEAVVRALLGGQVQTTDNQVCYAVKLDNSLLGPPPGMNGGASPALPPFAGPSARPTPSAPLPRPAAKPVERLSPEQLAERLPTLLASLQPGSYFSAWNALTTALKPMRGQWQLALSRDSSLNALPPFAKRYGAVMPKAEIIVEIDPPPSLDSLQQALGREDARETTGGYLNEQFPIDRIDLDFTSPAQEAAAERAGGLSILDMDARTLMQRGVKTVFGIELSPWLEIELKVKRRFRLFDDDPVVDSQPNLVPYRVFTVDPKADKPGRVELEWYRYGGFRFGVVDGNVVVVRAVCSEFK